MWSNQADPAFAKSIDGSSNIAIAGVSAENLHPGRAFRDIKNNAILKVHPHFLLAVAYIRTRTKCPVHLNDRVVV